MIDRLQQMHDEVAVTVQRAKQKDANAALVVQAAGLKAIIAAALDHINRSAALREHLVTTAAPRDELPPFTG